MTNKGINILAGILLCFFILSFSITLTTLQPFIYNLYIPQLQELQVPIPEETIPAGDSSLVKKAETAAPLETQDSEIKKSLSRSEIKENYQKLISFCLNPYQKELSFTALAMSAEGLQHFHDVKAIFSLVIGILIFTTVLLIPLSLMQFRKGNYQYLRYGGRLSLLIPLCLGSFISINFEESFAIFHKIFFRNDYWLFRPERDPIILYLPADFFKSMALAILVIILTCSLLCLFLAKQAERKRS